MGRKKKPKESDHAPPKEQEEERAREQYDDSDSSDYEVQRRQHDIDPEIQELAYTFGIDDTLTQKLNDIMIEDRRRTWEQDLARLYEVLKEAHTPAAMLNMKLKDMEKGTFVGKAKCGPKVRELCKKHRLDKGASNKLEEAMSKREALGKDVEKDIQMLDEHLAASNAPSKLISMKLDSLRKGFNIGHCIYSRETLPGNQGPGVDGVFNKREKRPLGYTDADLDKRFAEQDGMRGGGQLMDEATVRRMMAAERKQHEAQLHVETKPEPKKKGKRSASRGRGRSRNQKKRRSRTRSRSQKQKKGRSRTRSPKRRSASRAGKQKKSRSRTTSRKRTRSHSRSAKLKSSRGRSTSRGRKGSGKPKRSGTSDSSSSGKST